MNIDHTILTVITFVPLAGAVLLALLPDKGKRMQWGALAITVITFALTLHLPIRYDYAAASGSFQFDQNLPVNLSFNNPRLDCFRPFQPCPNFSKKG